MKLEIGNKKLIMKWGMVIISIIYCFLTMLYYDNNINSEVGYRYISSVFNGTFKEFYNSTGWSYGVTIYTIYAIWSIPVWIINHIIGTENLLAIPTLLWYKLLLVMFAIWSIYIVGRISECYIEDKKEEIQLQYVCSSLFIFPVIAISQCDVIGLCFVLLGVLYYLKEDNKKFVIYFAIAVTMKYFALFVFIPLVLYRYRRLNKLMGVLLAGVVLIAFSLLFVSYSSTGIAAISNSEYYVNRHLRAFNNVSIQMGEYTIVGILGFFYMILCVTAYILPNDEKQTRIRFSIWIATAGYLCFFLCYFCKPYWYVLLAPFLVLLAYSNPKKRKVNLILETVFANASLFGYIYVQDWMFMGKYTYSFTLLKHFGVAATGNLVQAVFNQYMPVLESFQPTIQGIAYASAALLLVINFPKVQIDSNETEESIEKDVNIITWLKIALIYMWIILSVVGLIKAQSPYWYKGNAVIEKTKSGVYNYECQYTGSLYERDDGLWMGSELDIILHYEDTEDTDLLLTTYGYSVSADVIVEIYVDSVYIGNLSREDETLNITNRYITIPKELLPEMGDVTISLKTTPKASVTDDEGEEHLLGLYISNLNIKEIR